MASHSLEWCSEEDGHSRWPSEKAFVPKPPAEGFSSEVTWREVQGVHEGVFKAGQDIRLRVASINVCSTANGSKLKTTVPVREGGLTPVEVMSLAIAIETCEADVVCLQQLNLISPEWELLCKELGNAWSSVCSHHGEMLMNPGGLSGLAVFSKLPISFFSVRELTDAKYGRDLDRRAVLVCEIAVSPYKTLRLVNVLFEEIFEDLRVRQFQNLQNLLQKEFPSFVSEGHVLAGALNGLQRSDYSTGAWDWEAFERARLKESGAITEQPRGDLMALVLRGAGKYRDVRAEAGFDGVFEDGAKIEASGKHEVRTDYVLLSERLGWMPVPKQYDVLPNPPAIKYSHHVIVVDIYNKKPRQHVPVGEPRAPTATRRFELASFNTVVRPMETPKLSNSLTGSRVQDLLTTPPYSTARGYY